MNLQGKVLVSHPSLTQGLFAKSVVYIYQHEHKGSLGVILNKRSNFSVAEIMSQKGILFDHGHMCFTGGPVNQQALQILHSDDWYSQNTLQLPQGLSISSDTVMLEKIAMGKLNKFFKERTLLNQAFVKNNKQNIAQYLDSVSSGLTVTDFKHVKLG